MTTTKSVSLSKYVNPDIVDDLTTDDATKVLSAKQGKVLSGLIDGKSDTGHTHSTTGVTNSTTLSNLGSNLTTQDAVNTAINNRIGDILSFFNGTGGS